MPRHHALLRLDRNVVPLLHGQRRVHLQMRVNDDHVAHFSRAQIVHVRHAGRRGERLPNRRDLHLVHATIHQIVQRVPPETPTHLRHHKAHDQRRNRVKNRVTHQVAHDAHAHHQRRGGVGARMPRVRHQHARLHALRNGQHVAKQNLLRRQARERHPQRNDVHLRDGLRVLQLHSRRPQHPHTHRQQHRTQKHRRPSLIPMVPIRMIFVRVFLARMVRQQHHKIRHQIG